MKIQQHCFDDGTEERLATIMGELHTNGGNAYGKVPPIPVEIFVVKQFPKKLPVVYVRPPQFYAISPSKYVDNSGLVDFSKMGVTMLAADHSAFSTLILVLTTTLSSSPPVRPITHTPSSPDLRGTRSAPSEYPHATEASGHAATLHPGAHHKHDPVALSNDPFLALRESLCKEVSGPEKPEKME